MMNEHQNTFENLPEEQEWLLLTCDFAPIITKNHICVLW